MPGGEHLKGEGAGSLSPEKMREWIEREILSPVLQNTFNYRGFGAGENGVPTTEEEPRSPLNLDHDRFDRRTYGEVLEASQNLRQVVGQLPFDSWGNLVQDIWGAFFKRRPEFLPETGVDPANLINRVFVERLLSDPDVQTTRATTVLDELAAAVAAIAAASKLAEEYEKRPELQEAVQRAQKKLVEAQNGDVKEQDGDDGDNDDNTQDADQNTGEEIASPYQEALAEIEQEAVSLRQAIRAAAEAAKDEAREAVEAFIAWGIDPAELRTASIETRFRLLNQLRRPFVRQVADLVGRLKNAAWAARREVIRHDTGEIHSITLGRDIERVLPAELVQLKHPLRRLDFYRRFLEGQTLQYALRERERLARGPIVCCVDVSASMEKDGRINWALAVAMTLVAIASRDRRHAAVMHFDTRVKRTVEFAPKEKDPQKIVEVLEVEAGGGTSYAEPLTAAFEWIQKRPDYKKADIVFITDGECDIKEDFLRVFCKKKEKNELQVFGVMIGSDPDDTLRKFADYVLRLPDGSDGIDVARAIFQTVQKER